MTDSHPPPKKKEEYLSLANDWVEFVEPWQDGNALSLCNVVCGQIQEVGMGRCNHSRPVPLMLLTCL